MDTRPAYAHWATTGRAWSVVTCALALIMCSRPLAAQSPANNSPLPGVARSSVIPQIRASGAKNSATNPIPTSPNVPPQLIAPASPPLPLPPRTTVAQPLPSQRDRYGREQRQPILDPSVRPAAFFDSPGAPPQPASAPPSIPTPASITTANAQANAPQPGAPTGEHPLMPAIVRARSALETIAKIQDYSATLVKRERIDGTLGEHQYLFVKVRHDPFSVYLYFLAPAELKGQETIFIAGKNDGNLLAHPNGLKGKLLGTVSLNPTGMLAMSGNRYPITEIGIKRLSERLIEVGTNDMKYGECAVKILPGAKINGRDCTCYEVQHPQPRKEFIFHLARIYLDSELNVPIRYEAYDWPSEAGGPPVLVEEYTYLNLKLNNGFTDLDFDVNNPKYQFK